MPDGFVPGRTRVLVGERARGRCEYCLSPESHSSSGFTIDHIHPTSKGGSSEIENLALACGGCNGRKNEFTHAKDPLTDELVSLYHPRRDVWREHFEWADGNTRIEAKTPTGRATVALLRMNREGVVNLRTALVQLGLHPPVEVE
jgi:hypothetical protein